MVDAAPCRTCGTLVQRPAPNMMIPFLCPKCRRIKDAATDAELREAMVGGQQRSRYQAWQDRLFVEHQQGWHRVIRKQGCPPCDIQYSEKMKPQPEEEGVPRALR